jgi:predicted aconitase
MVWDARLSLTINNGSELSAVSIGTPHFSVSEFEGLLALLDGRRAAVDFYVSTGRGVLAEIEARGWVPALDDAGVQVVVDTCTYITPIIRRDGGLVMTNSAKWAYYAPANLGIGVVFGSTEECVRSAIGGRVWRDEQLWAQL